MADSGGDGCSRCCCRFILSVGLTALFMWLSLRTSNPKCSVQTLYLASLDRTLNLTTDPTLNFTLRLDNPNKDKGIKYDSLNVTVYDDRNKSHAIASNILMPGFYQGHRKKAKKPGQGKANTTAASQAVFENGTGVLWVDMATSVRFKILFWYTKRHKIRVGADVVVNASGVKVDHKGIKLKSLAAQPRMGSFCLVVGALMNFLIFTLLNFW